MPKITPKRINYISWDEYFMGVALLSAERSKDPNTQVGTCIINSQNKIVGVGYNGFPTGCSDDALPWNSIGKFLVGCIMYTALFPCNECAKAIIQSGIKEIVYLSDKYSDADMTKAAKLMFKQSGVKL